MREGLIRLLAVGDPLRLKRSPRRPSLSRSVQRAKMPNELPKYRLGTRQRSERLDGPGARPKVRIRLRHSVEQDLTIEDGSVDKPMNLLSSRGNLCAVCKREDRYLCDDHWICAGVEDLDL